MKKYLVFLLLASTASLCSANNIRVSNVSLSLTPNTISHYTTVIFDVAWDNSWRTNVGPSNWDAGWIFVKYRLKNSIVWKHATLNYVNGTGTGDGHTVPSGATIASANDSGAGGARGVFIYANGILAQSNVNYTSVALQWNYGADGLSDADRVEVCVMAVEMVYVPAGPYSLGDGNTTIHGQFRQQATNTPFQVTNENSIILGGAVSTSLLNNNAVGQSTPDDFNNATTQLLPAAFPKGTVAYYMMKYEISQEQYAEFLNKLTRQQQQNRFSSSTVGNFFANAAGVVTPSARNGIKLITDPGVLSIRIYGCDLNNNGVAGEAADGQNIACNFLSSTDLQAYLDWSGLRPITEFEYEKSARGPNPAISGEYAWEATTIQNATGITNSGANNEVATNAGANSVFNSGTAGPMRVGNFAQAATSQLQAGAGYYGFMELTGNVWEQVVLAGNAAGRSFTGLNGNGTLNTNGEADVDFWPGINGNTNPASPNTVYGGTTGASGYAGISFCGGTWNAGTWLTVSDRDYRGSGWTGVNGRDNRNGGRGGRLAP